MALSEPRATALDRLTARGVEPERILGPEELRWLRGAFERAVGDAEQLSADAFHEALLENLPTHDTLPEGHAELLLEVRELRGDQMMGFDQLVMAAAQRRVGALEQRAWNTFTHFDIDDDGFVDRSELARLTQAGASAEDVAKLIADADADGNGKIDYEEFLAWYTDHHNRSGGSSA